ncbi:dienelactone hydrolase family protein [Agromyces sp. MMS24-K17]|uniref:dienelactone hydrolase family protein n=1 Tax=Agromyces sp. MMS24-K17 TaxID=3372850 RepID=UPI003754B79A
MSAASPIEGYEDWPATAWGTARRRVGMPRADAVAAAIGVPVPPTAVAPRVVDRVEADGLEVTALAWPAGYGPETRAFLLRPAGERGILPGVLALHAHGGQFATGALQLVRADPWTEPAHDAFRDRYFDGLAAANDLARRGFAVLAHDAFLWDSRRARRSRVERSPQTEETISKAAGMLGTTLAGMVAHDDLVAFDVLAGLPGVDADRIGAFGFSGGGGRAWLLASLEPRLRAVVQSGMTATFDSLVPDYLDSHSWLLFAPGLRQVAEWPLVVDPAGGAHALVQADTADPLFPADGVRDAVRMLRAAWSPDRLRVAVRDVGHVCDAEMQAEAWAFLAERLGAGT